MHKPSSSNSDRKVAARAPATMAKTGSPAQTPPAHTPTRPVPAPDGVTVVLGCGGPTPPSHGANPQASIIAVCSPPSGIRIKTQLHSAGFKTVGMLALLTAGLGLGQADSLWIDGLSRSMVSDKRAHAVGDILHILVQESTSASKNNNTKTSRKSDLDAKLSTFFYSPAASGLLTKKGQLPALKLGSSSGFDGGGRIDNTERIAARIAVVVVDTLPNGNLVIEGRRQTVIAGETQDIVLRGLVRPADIHPNNTVHSYNVAEATIRLVSRGVVSDSQRKGWFHRLWDKVTPF